MGRDDVVEFNDVKVIKASERAILCRCDDWYADEWIPLSQISDDSDVFEEGDEGLLIVTEWIATQKGLI